MLGLSNYRDSTHYCDSFGLIHYRDSRLPGHLNKSTIIIVLIIVNTTLSTIVIVKFSALMYVYTYVHN